MVCCCLKNKRTSRMLAVPVSFKFEIRESMAVVRTKLVVLRSCGKIEVCMGSVITTSSSMRPLAEPTSIVPPEINSRVCKTKQYHIWLQYQLTMKKHQKTYFWQHRRFSCRLTYTEVRHLSWLRYVIAIDLTILRIKWTHSSSTTITPKLGWRA